MDEYVIFKPTAFKHGVSEADIRHAFDRPRKVYRALINM
jgi:hypothetical protein